MEKVILLRIGIFLFLAEFFYVLHKINKETKEE